MRGLAIAALVLATPMSALAQTAENSSAAEIEAVYACVEIAEDAARLSCYDEAANRMRRAQAEGQFVAVDRRRVETMRRESFGFSVPSFANLLPRGGNAEESIDRLELTVARILSRPDGRLVYVMDNGQQWAQVEPSGIRNVRPGDSVTIRSAALGTFMLVGQRGGAGHRVRRQE